jgi:microcystin-dependent protein
MKTTSLLNLFALLAFCAGQVQAQSPAPRLLPFQGRLTDQNGTVVTNGVRLVQFKIYDAPSAGNAVWPGELHRTTVNGGLVNVLLGTKTPFPSTNAAGGQFFDQQLYLEITVDVSGPGRIPDGAITAADPPMRPRQVLLPVVFAKEAADSRTLAGRDWTPIFGFNSPDGPIPAGKLAAESITASQIAPRAITSNQIASRTITSNEIASGTINLGNLATLVAEALNPPGTIVAFAGMNPPAGWWICDGRVVSRTDYPILFNAIGTAWGSGNGSTTFNLPDLRGYFLRGVDGNAGRDPNNATRTASNPGGNPANAVGSVQSESVSSHTHLLSVGSLNNFNDYFGGSTATYGILDVYNRSDATSIQQYPALQTVGGAENRPKNVYVNYIIKH